jgi:hypothetical protein
MSERQPIVNQIINLILREEGVDVDQPMNTVHVATLAKHACDLVAVIGLAARVTGGGGVELMDIIRKKAERSYEELDAAYSALEQSAGGKP